MGLSSWKILINLLSVFIGRSAFSMEKAYIRQMIYDHLSEALDNAPSIIVFDDLDSIVTSGVDIKGSQTPASVVSLAKFIAEIIDEYGVTYSALFQHQQYNSILWFFYVRL
ncbi:hypothetical protein RND81_13G108800 [Saponaria officinalis]|uniref:ATPase AAA-type core domain-containing protein n=1 Tax=Saponaria officinalis TaxID=3572 RepID=A0AAW1GZZ3_SAPOF